MIQFDSTKCKTFWMSTDKMTVLVETYDDIVTNTPAIIGKFKNQPIDNLRNWLRKQGGYREEILCSEKGK